MRTEVKPWAGGFLAALLYLAFVAWALAIGSGCDHRPGPVRPAAQAGFARSLEDAKKASVIVITECGAGSGTLLDATHALTAFHVVDCAVSEETVSLANSVEVLVTDGRRIPATFYRLDPSRDLAVLLLAHPGPEGVKPALVSRVVANGQMVCAFVTLPEPEVKCMLAKKGQADRRYGDVLLLSETIWHGNSGAAIYNADGELVSVVTRFLWCSAEDARAFEKNHVQPNKTCGGRASTVEGRVLE